MSGVHKDPPSHGPVRRITDPQEFSRIAEKFARGPIPCTGNRIRLKNHHNCLYNIYDREREISDHEIKQALDANRSLPAERQLSPKKRAALNSFRERLSQEGDIFTDHQVGYLLSLISRATDPARKDKLSKEEFSEVKDRVKAFFAFVRDFKAGKPQNAATIISFFTSVEFFMLEAKARKILEPFGLEGEAQDFLLQSGASIMGGYLVTLNGNNYPPKEWGRTVFRDICDEYRSTASLIPSLSDHVRILETELRDVPPATSEIVRDKIQSISMLPNAVLYDEGYLSVNCVQGGSPGSGSGGSPTHK